MVHHWEIFIQYTLNAINKAISNPTCNWIFNGGVRTEHFNHPNTQYNMDNNKMLIRNFYTCWNKRIDFITDNKPESWTSRLVTFKEVG